MDQSPPYQGLFACVFESLLDIPWLIVLDGDVDSTGCDFGDSFQTGSNSRVS